MVSINKNNGIENNYKNIESTKQNQKEETIVSIFNEDGDKVFSVEEQKKALAVKITEIYNKFKDLLDKSGFNLKDFIENESKNIKQDENLGGIATEITEMHIRKKINDAESKILDIADEQLKKEDEEIMKLILSKIDVMLFSYGEENLEQLKNLVNDYESIMDKENPEHVAELNSRKSLINIKYPDTYEILESE